MFNNFGIVLSQINKLVGWCLSLFTKKRRLRRRLEALRVEIQKCASVAQTYRTAGIKPPNYDLPTRAYDEFYADLVSEIDIDEITQRLVEDFYTNVRALNRGIINANEFHKQGNDKGLDEEWNRNQLKATHILELYDDAVASVTKMI